MLESATPSYAEKSQKDGHYQSRFQMTLIVSLIFLIIGFSYLPNGARRLGNRQHSQTCISL